jgi:hypothetical protein
MSFISQQVGGTGKDDDAMVRHFAALTAIRLHLDYISTAIPGHPTQTNSWLTQLQGKLIFAKRTKLATATITCCNAKPQTPALDLAGSLH